MQDKLMHIFALSSLMLFTGVIFQLVQKAQNNPYMDEIFHIPQAQQYCRSNFSHWDPMITTLPGLYITSFLSLNIIRSFSGVSLVDLCTTQNLRAMNLLFCIGNFAILFILGKKLNEKSKGKDVNKTTKQLLINTIVLFLFPVLYFFSWLYYTDPGSTFFTLLMYTLCLHNFHKCSSLFGIIAILFRQTNVVWVLFCFVLVAIEILEKELQHHTKEKIHNFRNTDLLKLLLKILLKPAIVFKLSKKIIFHTYSYVCVIAGFIAFVKINNGIVVGDRSNHVASCNIPQVFYFLLVSLLFSFFNFFHTKNIFAFFRAILKNPFNVLLMVALSAIAVKYLTYEHKYTLSDNRHYTFYVWSRLFKKFHWARYTFIPSYLFSLYQFFSVTSHRGILWQLLFFTCAAACLVPQSLFEFRYYIVPFLILRLNMTLPCSRILLAELFCYILLNVFTVYMFISRPFYWPNDPLPQRFMW
uniref:Dol-P-Glc:Glc(2)Man(9)GlcNAc(2)-PP-Dol alpha-1,2-glucosyltransferase n=2 Tax=Biomphalaria glabrata TaxID=6526 RepID=A0A2C9JD25_BIOGL